MITLLELKKEKVASTKKLRKETLLVSGVSMFFLAVLCLAIVFSQEDYRLLEILLILAGTLYLWWLLYELSVPYKEALQKKRFYENAEKGLHEEKEVTVVSYEAKTSLSKNGLEAGLLKTSYLENGRSFERDYYIYGVGYPFQAGSKIRASSTSGVLVSFEVIS